MSFSIGMTAPSRGLDLRLRVAWADRLCVVALNAALALNVRSQVEESVDLAQTNVPMARTDHAVESGQSGDRLFIELEPSGRRRPIMRLYWDRLDLNSPTCGGCKALLVT